MHRAMAELIYARNPDSLDGIASELHQAEVGLKGEDLARLAYQEGAVELLKWRLALRGTRLSNHHPNPPMTIGLKAKRASPMRSHSVKKEI